jgi:three-Cys-motif partner protein
MTTKHSFGGPWTQIKLEMLRRYLPAFNTALQNKPIPTSRFRRIYIDAFAGTGECEIKAGDSTVETIAGSASLAIETLPSFDEIHLIDLNEKHVADLERLAAGSNVQAHVHREDANVALQTIVGRIDWKRSRGVLFLDPYGMGVPWSTLELAASTQALDVWYLFPLSAIYRQAAKNFEKIDDAKLAALDAVLGTSTWREIFYQYDGQNSLMGDGEHLVRTVDASEIATFVHQRLMTVFKGWVSEPLFLRNNKGAPLFALFCCISNPSEKAVKLSRRMAAHILERFDKPVKRNKQSSDIGTTQNSLFDHA